MTGDPMRKFSALLVLPALLGGCVTGSNQVSEVRARIVANKELMLQAGNDLMPADDEAAFAHAKAVVASKLKDPDSARFSGLRVNSYLGGRYVCGLVNAKNSYGGYVGNTPFVSGYLEAFLSSEGTDGVTDFAVYKIYCTPESAYHGAAAN